MVESAVRKFVGRLVFDLERGEEKTTRTIEIPYAKTDATSQEIQDDVNNAYSIFVPSSGGLNTFIQPASWRDTNDTEEQWTTTNLSYEVVETITTRITHG